MTPTTSYRPVSDTATSVPLTDDIYLQDLVRDHGEVGGRERWMVLSIGWEEERIAAGRPGVSRLDPEAWRSEVRVAEQYFTRRYGTDNLLSRLCLSPCLYWRLFPPVRPWSRWRFLPPFHRGLITRRGSTQSGGSGASCPRKGIGPPAARADFGGSRPVSRWRWWPGGLGRQAGV